jgi:hypothetical protein
MKLDRNSWPSPSPGLHLSVGQYIDRLCGLVVRVLGYRFGGPGFDSHSLQNFPTKKKKRKTSSGSRTGSTQPREYN